MNIEDVVQFLKERAGYTQAANSLALLGMQLSFDAVLIGPEQHDGLLLIESAAGRGLNLLLNKMKALALALERTDSARTLTLVLLDSEPAIPAYVELNRICRLFILQENIPLEQALASILPLFLPAPVMAGDGAENTLKSELDEEANNPVVMKLIRAARVGEFEVEKSVRETVEDLSKPLEIR